MLSLSQSLFEDGGAYIELGAKNEGNELLYIINVPTDNFFGILSKLCEDLGFIYMYGDCEGRLYECPNSLIIFYLINTLKLLKISSFISVGVKLVGTPLWNWF